MRKYTFEDYTLTLEWAGVGDYGKSKVAYWLEKAGEDVPIFEGSDLQVPYSDDPEGPRSAAALLGFLTLQRGDVEDEYFDDYTPRQLEFRDNEAEGVSYWEYALVCPECGTVEPEDNDADYDLENPAPWWMGQDPTRCEACGTLLE
jgi:hypothetical protein